MTADAAGISGFGMSFGGDAAEDPDRLDARAMAFVSEAAALLREAAKPADDAAIDRVVQRVRMEAVIGTVAWGVGGALSRLGDALPDLLGLIDDPGGVANPGGGTDG